MRICLMVEGQEDVGWDDWVALAGACERSGLEGLFRSDHYQSVFGDEERGSLDAWATRHGARRDHRRGSGSGRWSRPRRSGTRPRSRRSPPRPTTSRAGGSSSGSAPAGASASTARYGFDFHDTPTRVRLFAEQLEIIHRQWTEESFSFAGEHYTLEDCRAQPPAAAAPAPAADRRRRRRGRAPSCRRCGSPTSTTRPT